MKFAHFADVHIGAWRDPKLRDLSVNAFIGAVDKAVQESVDFILISGDLFNNAIPAIDSLKIAVTKLRELRDRDIPVYIIAGSHDFSPSGKTMIDVLEEAELVRNVCRGNVDENNALTLEFTVDPKTGAKITGMIGKKGMLEKKYYEKLNREKLEKETGFKIFMFHTGITELKPDYMEHVPSEPLSLLPKNFDYYAGGHLHYIFEKDVNGFGKITFPGALFPCNFKEIEQFKHGGLFIFEDRDLKWEPIIIKEVKSFKFDVNHRLPGQAYNEIIQKIQNDVYDCIVTLRIEGKILSGKTTDIDLKEILKKFYEKGAYFVMKNTNKLTSEEFEEIQVASGSVEEVEKSIILEHAGQIQSPHADEKEITLMLMHALNMEKDEGERAVDFEERVKDEVNKVLGLKEVFR